jgi:hypothetical protein
MRPPGRLRSRCTVLATLIQGAPLLAVVPDVPLLVAAVLRTPVRTAPVLPGGLSEKPNEVAVAGGAVGPTSEASASSRTTAGPGWLHGPIAPVLIVIHAILSARRTRMRRLAAMPSRGCPVVRTRQDQAQQARTRQAGMEEAGAPPGRPATTWRRLGRASSRLAGISGQRSGLTPTGRTAHGPARRTTPRRSARSLTGDSGLAITDQATAAGLTPAISGQVRIDDSRTSETAIPSLAGIRCGVLTVTGAPNWARIRGDLRTATRAVGRVPNGDGLPTGQVAAALTRYRTRRAGQLTPRPDLTVQGGTWIPAGRHLTATEFLMLTERVSGVRPSDLTNTAPAGGTRRRSVRGSAGTGRALSWDRPAGGTRRRSVTGSAGTGRALARARASGEAAWRPDGTGGWSALSRNRASGEARFLGVKGSGGIELVLSSDPASSGVRRPGVTASGRIGRLMSPDLTLTGTTGGARLPTVMGCRPTEPA